MKIAFAKPCWDYPKGRSEATYNRVWTPLELANCAAIARQAGHSVTIVDAQAARLSPAQLTGRVSGADLVVLTSSGLDRWQCPYNDPTPFVAAAREMTKAGLRVVVTGFHGTVAPEAALRLTGAEAVIRGEPEEAIGEIAAGRALSVIDGVSFMRGGEVVNNPDRAAVDITRLPVPAFELFDLRRYFYEVLDNEFLLIEATRGCPYGCVFCSKVMYGEKFRKKTAEQVCAEIDWALDHTKARNVYFIDLEFTVARDLAEAISRHLIKRGAPVAWCCQTRSDNVDEELLKLMRKSGCRLIHLGVESGSEEVLTASGKATTKEAIYKGVRMIEAAGIETLAFFMFGLPGESKSQREETIEFAIELDPTYASFHFATPYPGSRLFEDAKTRMTAELSFPLVPPGADIEDLKKWVRRAMRRFYLRPSYVARHLGRGGPAHWLRQLRLFASYFR